MADLVIRVDEVVVADVIVSGLEGSLAFSMIISDYASYSLVDAPMDRTRLIAPSPDLSSRPSLQHHRTQE